MRTHPIRRDSLRHAQRSDSRPARCFPKSVPANRNEWNQPQRIRLGIFPVFESVRRQRHRVRLLPKSPGQTLALARGPRCGNGPTKSSSHPRPRRPKWRVYELVPPAGIVNTPGAPPSRTGSTSCPRNAASSPDWPNEAPGNPPSTKGSGTKP